MDCRDTLVDSLQAVICSKFVQKSLWRVKEEEPEEPQRLLQLAAQALSSASPGGWWPSERRPS